MAWLVTKEICKASISGKQLCEVSIIKLWHCSPNHGPQFHGAANSEIGPCTVCSRYKHRIVCFSKCWFFTYGLSKAKPWNLAQVNNITEKQVQRFIICLNLVCNSNIYHSAAILCPWNRTKASRKIDWPPYYCVENQYCDHCLVFREPDQDGRSVVKV